MNASHNFCCSELGEIKCDRLEKDDRQHKAADRGQCKDGRVGQGGAGKAAGTTAEQHHGGVRRADEKARREEA